MSTHDKSGDDWTSEHSEACRRAGWYVPEKSKGFYGFYPSEPMRAFKDGYDAGKQAAASAVAQPVVWGPERQDCPGGPVYRVRVLTDAPSSARLSEDRLREIAKKHARQACNPINALDQVSLQEQVRAEEVIFYALKDAAGAVASASADTVSPGAAFDHGPAAARGTITCGYCGVVQEHHYDCPRRAEGRSA